MAGENEIFDGELPEDEDIYVPHEDDDGIGENQLEKFEDTTQDCVDFIDGPEPMNENVEHGQWDITKDEIKGR